MRKTDVPTLLAEAFPAFHLVDEVRDPSNSEYLVVAAFARQAVATAKSGAFDYFPGLFSVIERVFEQGSESEQSLLGAGFLEDLQGAAVQATAPGDSFDPDLFTQWMGPKTSAAWRGLLTGLKGNPSDLKTLVKSLYQSRDVRSMTKAELKTARRAERRKVR